MARRFVAFISQCPGIVRDALLGPNFEGRHQGVLGELLGDADVAGDAGNGGDEPCGFDLPQGPNRLSYIAHAT